VFQLRRFADMASDGVPFLAGRPGRGRWPASRPPRHGRVRVPLGPVAMFAASNFPFAFSVPGGDTASALAAGCSLVIKAHAGHPLTSQRVHGLMQQVLQAPAPARRPDRHGARRGQRGGLAAHPASADCGGRLHRLHPRRRCAASLAKARPRPIPFYGELGSINPIIALPCGAGRKGAELAATLAGSISAGLRTVLHQPRRDRAVPRPGQRCLCGPVDHGPVGQRLRMPC
jgi:hypothetical protein